MMGQRPEYRTSQPQRRRQRGGNLPADGLDPASANLKVLNVAPRQNQVAPSVGERLRKLLAFFGRRRPQFFANFLKAVLPAAVNPAKTLPWSSTPFLPTIQRPDLSAE